MRAVTFSEFGGPEQIAVIDRPEPTPAEGEVLVAVQAASINPVDVAVRSGAFATPAASLAPYTPGWDLAGTIVAVGEGVDEALVGSYVLGFSPWFAAANGTQAALVALPRDQVASAPASIPPEELTTLGLNALTAIQAVRAAAVETGTTVLVSGASGAVGGFAVQFASRAGATVWAMASDEDDALVTGFGAARRLPRSADDAISAVHTLTPDGVDVVIDTASLGAGILGAIRDGGRYVTVTGPPEASRDIRVQRVGVRANADDLQEIVDLASQGHLALRVAKTFDVEDATEAYRTFEAGGHRGRIVIVFGER